MRPRVPGGDLKRTQIDMRVVLCERIDRVARTKTPRHCVYRDARPSNHRLTSEDVWVAHDKSVTVCRIRLRFRDGLTSWFR
jgi:hypothetical protein